MDVLLTRQGSKRRIAAKVKEYFPDHKIYIEPFFGAGGMFFSKDPVQYNILNDADAEVFNLFTVLTQKPGALKELLQIMPHHEALFRFCKDNGVNDYLGIDVWNAARFIYMSNHSFMGDLRTMRYGTNNTKKLYLERIEETAAFLKRTDVQFTNCDFRDMFRRISFQRNRSADAFIYADPPYLNTGNTYNTPKWKENDVVDLLDVLVKTGMKFAMSEFDNDIVVNLAKERDLNITVVGERQNLSNRATEILITNYN